MSEVRALRVFAVFLAVLFVCGCGSGDKRYKAYGTVKYKDQPVKAGLITFFAEGSTASAGGASISDGKYDLPQATGLLAGNYKVSISVPDPKKAAKEGEAPGVTLPSRETLPAKYNANTELKAEVKPGGSNEFNFDLK